MSTPPVRQRGTDDVAAVRAIARDVGRAVNEVKWIYLVGSRLMGTATEASDFDLIVGVNGALRPLSPHWLDKGAAPGNGFATTCLGAPIHWQVVSVDEFDRVELEEDLCI